MEHKATFGNFSVYKRLWGEPDLKKYVVFHEPEGTVLADFRTYASAVTWAQGQRRDEQEKSYETVPVRP